MTSVTTDVARGMATSMQLERAPVARQARADWPAPASPAPPSPAPAAVPLLEAAEPLMPPRPDLAARFDELMVQYDRLIRAIVARLGRRFGLSRDSFLVQDDIAQEVRFDIWKQIARGQVIDFPATYIYKATIRETVRALRRMTTREMESIEEKGVADQVVDGADPFKLLAARDQFKAIVAGIRALAPDRQAAVTAHLSGFQFQEVMVMHAGATRRRATWSPGAWRTCGPGSAGSRRSGAAAPTTRGWPRSTRSWRPCGPTCGPCRSGGRPRCGWSPRAPGCASSGVSRA